MTCTHSEKPTSKKKKKKLNMIENTDVLSLAAPSFFTLVVPALPYLVSFIDDVFLYSCSTVVDVFLEGYVVVSEFNSVPLGGWQQSFSAEAELRRRCLVPLLESSDALRALAVTSGLIGVHPLLAAGTIPAWTVVVDALIYRCSHLVEYVLPLSCVVWLGFCCYLSVVVDAFYVEYSHSHCHVYNCY